jgi:release factor glutamine methyltransferase
MDWRPRTSGNASWSPSTASPAPDVVLAGGHDRRIRPPTPAGTARPGSGPVTTIGAALRGATAALAPSPSARLDAELLLAHLLDVSRARLLAATRDPIDADLARRLTVLVDRRSGGEPVAYIVGRAWFCGLEVEVCADVLIPRPETELLVAWARERIAARPGPVTVLDVGTGSGAIALALAMDARVRARRVRIRGTDASAPALAVAWRNVGRLAVGDVIDLEHADLFPSGQGRYDVITANLPYIGTDEIDDVAPEVLRFEPHAALLSGRDGLDAIRRLLEGLPARVSPGAEIGLEIGWRQGDAVCALARAGFPDARVRIHPDLEGRDRLITIACPGPG